MSTIASPRSRARAARRCAGASVTQAQLGRYEDPHTGAIREVVSVPGVGGSRLVVDRLLGTRGDARLVAHLAADEPPENERQLCAMYLADDRRGTCRHLRPDDFEAYAITERSLPGQGGACTGARLTDADGFAFDIRQLAGDSVVELRWARSLHWHSQTEPVTLRQVVSRFEDYEPMRAMTRRALDTHESDPRISTVTLSAELARLNASRIVLNRGLREAVVERVTRGQLTLSEIAMRCERLKRDARGNVAGETSWLGRRIGQVPESGKLRPTPWIHSEVLALIAREGLGICPHEVEVG